MTNNLHISCTNIKNLFRKPLLRNKNIGDCTRLPCRCIVVVVEKRIAGRGYRNGAHALVAAFGNLRRDNLAALIDDYIDRFYNKEAARSKRLAENGYAVAKQIVAWKEKVAALWDGIKVFDVITTDHTNTISGDKFSTKVIVDSYGIGRDLHVELVVYKQEDGEEKLQFTKQFEVVKEEGNVLTFELNDSIVDAGVFRYGYRIYPTMSELPHRMDFAFCRWV